MNTCRMQEKTPETVSYLTGHLQAIRLIQVFKCVFQMCIPKYNGKEEKEKSVLRKEKNKKSRDARLSPVRDLIP